MKIYFANDGSKLRVAILNYWNALRDLYGMHNVQIYASLASVPTIQESDQDKPTHVACVYGTGKNNYDVDMFLTSIPFVPKRIILLEPHQTIDSRMIQYERFSYFGDHMQGRELLNHILDVFGGHEDT
jgi:hypothetical protein